MKMEVSAKARTEQGTGASRRLRRAGWVPGILYGGREPAVAIQVDQLALMNNLKHEAFHSSILTMDLEGKKEQVLLRDVQMHPFKKQVLHVDFQRVAQDQKIHVKVPLHFVNADIAPGVKLSGGIVSHVMTEVDVVCLPKDLPEYIEVDVGHLTVGHSLHLADVKLPEGVEAVALHKGDNPVVATILVHRGAVEEEAAAAAPVAAEVPLVGAEKKEEKKES
ncbi:50S ribosomal protein L25/general stress protein Ctc [Pelomicrobium sp.]|jgi:large subunit ribosomal protein L25|uniref:50S ribosomal protein L25/general stress protein Ctc n=1 Tax=Pelomicrobium sp. TaxID=2815319 RepID=UPI002FDE252A